MVLLLVTGCGGSTTTTGAPGTTLTTQPPVTSQTSGTSQTTGTTQPGPDGDSFTAADLATFDGKDGRPAYVAVDGVVYDVSESRSWSEGQHTRCNLGAMAGRDLSAEIQQAPANMRALLERMPVVGQLVP